MLTDFTSLIVSGSKCGLAIYNLAPIEYIHDTKYTLIPFLSANGKIVFDGYIKFIDPNSLIILVPRCMVLVAHAHLNYYTRFLRVRVIHRPSAWQATYNPNHSLIPEQFDFEEVQAEVSPADAVNFRYQEIIHGIPRIRHECHTSYTAQMLSLLPLKVISLKVGCYPGQDITNRTYLLQKEKFGVYRGFTTNKIAKPITVVNYPEKIGLYSVDHAHAHKMPELQRLYLDQL